MKELKIIKETEKAYLIYAKYNGENGKLWIPKYAITENGISKQFLEKDDFRDWKKYNFEYAENQQKIIIFDFVKIEIEEGLKEQEAVEAIREHNSQELEKIAEEYELASIEHLTYIEIKSKIEQGVRVFAANISIAEFKLDATSKEINEAPYLAVNFNLPTAKEIEKNKQKFDGYKGMQVNNFIDMEK